MGKKILDQYTLLHFAIGIIAYFWNISLKTTFIAHTLFELLENTNYGIKLINNFPFWPGGKPRADTVQNQIGDTIGTIIGWITAKSFDNFGVSQGWYPKHL